MAGPRLISTAKVAVGRRRRASSSRVYGRIDDSTATAAPRARTCGLSRCGPAPAMPSGSVNSAAAVMASASPSTFGNRPPTRALSRMYAAHMPPAPRAKPIPAGSSRSKPVRPSSATPASARPAHSQVAARRAVDHGQRQRAQHLQGHRQAERDAVDRLVEQRVHAGQRHSERTDQRPSRRARSRVAGAGTPPASTMRGDPQPQRDHAGHAGAGKQQGRHPAAELHRQPHQPSTRPTAAVWRVTASTV